MIPVAQVNPVWKSARRFGCASAVNLETDRAAAAAGGE